SFKPLGDSKLCLKFVRIRNLLTLPLKTQGKISFWLNVWSHDLAKTLGGRQSRSLWKCEIKPRNRPKTEAGPKDSRGFYHATTSRYLNVFRHDESLQAYWLPLDDGVTIFRSLRGEFLVKILAVNGAL